jgi:hypothetical protein
MGSETHPFAWIIGLVVIAWIFLAVNGGKARPYSSVSVRGEVSAVADASARVIAILAESIENNGTASSGDLKFELWASDGTPNSSFTKEKIGEAELPKKIEARSRISPVNVRVKVSKLPDLGRPKTITVSLAEKESDGKKWGTVESFTMPEPFIFQRAEWLRWWERMNKWQWMSWATLAGGICLIFGYLAAAKSGALPARCGMGLPESWNEGRWWGELTFKTVIATAAAFTIFAHGNGKKAEADAVAAASTVGAPQSAPSSKEAPQSIAANDIKPEVLKPFRPEETSRPPESRTETKLPTETDAGMTQAVNPPIASTERQDVSQPQGPNRGDPALIPRSVEIAKADPPAQVGLGPNASNATKTIEEAKPFYGIGATLSPVNESSRTGAIITETTPGSPAAMAGLQVNDRVLAIDRVAVEDSTLDAILARIRSDDPAPITLCVMRNSEHWDFPMSRVKIASGDPSRLLTPTSRGPKGYRIIDNPFRYGVVGVNREDTLRIRSGPGSTYPEIGHLSYDEKQVRIVGKVEYNNGDQWVAISANDAVGWIHRSFIEPIEPW